MKTTERLLIHLVLSLLLFIAVALVVYCCFWLKRKYSKDIPRQYTREVIYSSSFNVLGNINADLFIFPSGIIFAGNDLNINSDYGNR